MKAGLRCGPVAAAALLAVAAVVTAQEPVPQFSAATDLVQVDVSVLDSRRRPVRGLTAADFVVLEDGQPRPVEAFTEVVLPAREQAVDSSWARAVPSDVAGNQAGEREGRVVILLMDRSIPVGQPTFAARQIASTAIDSLGPADLGAVLSTGVGLRRQNLTANKTLLRRLVNDPSVDWSQGASAESAAIEFDREKVQREMVRDMGINPDSVKAPFTDLTDGRCLCGACVPDTITAVAEALDDLPRYRKLVLFVGSAVRWQTDDDRGGCSVMLRSARNRMMAALERSSVTIHSIDPSGLEVVAEALVGSVRPVSSRLSPA